MEALFIANLELNENEGIYKKVLAQTKGLCHAVGSGHLITKSGTGCKVFSIDNDKSEFKQISILEAANQYIKQWNVRVLYIRHMVPSPKLIWFLRNAKKQGVKIFYEIPTYPYFAEQFRTSRLKHRAIIKITLDIVFWPIIYNYIDKLVVIKSNSNVKMYKKMAEITNGAFVDNIASKSYSDESKDCFSIVTVGTLYPYHGYDRVLRGLKECNEMIDGTTVEFNVVGSSQTIDDLKKMSNDMGLEHVKFHGIKTTEELNSLYEDFDIGLGCLALHRRNANIDTTIKIVEYYCRGIPVVTSGISPMDQYCRNCTIHIDDTDAPIDIKQIYQEFCQLDDKKKTISGIAKVKFSWDNIMNELIHDNENNL